jgi:hypothetical protein
MAEQSSLIYWRGSGEVRNDILAALSAEGYSLKVVRTFDEVLELCVRSLPALIVVDASAGENEASIRVVELSGAERIQDVAVLFFSNQATARGAVLKKQYSRFLSVDLPFSVSAFLSKLRGFLPSPSPAPDVTLTESETSDAEAPSETVSSRAAKKPRVRKDSLTGVAYRNKFLRNLDPANLPSSYGGELFCVAEETTDFDDRLLVPENHPKRELLQKALEAYQAESSWLGTHVRRVAFVTSAIANNLDWDAARDMKLRTSAIFLNWALRDQHHSILSADMFFPQNQRFVEMLSHAYQQGAEYLAQRAQEKEASTLLSNVSRIIAHGLPDTPELGLEAQTLLAVELTDRACWGTGVWDPYGAYRALRKLRQGKPIHVVEEVLDGLGRVLSEAASARQSTRTFIAEGEEENAEADKQKKMVHEAMEEAIGLFGGSAHVPVQVADLRPGMMLARPIVSWDGKLILRANIPLSADIIRRLWQMVTIRPIRPPISVLAVRRDMESSP